MVKTSLGLEENVAGALCYILGWISGIVFFLLEKENRFVRFHAMQSVATFLPLTLIIWIIPALFLWVPVVSWALLSLIRILILILWLVLMIKAYQGERYKLPIVGDFAEKQI
ncbi:MAG TPA: DUF4870 domain-containing protein [Methanomicrobia archaeon]|nr:DUF4870 domain-containing protein [Methanomicrobia archaeon]